ncbi:hypothetical protein THAOC_17855, partial [Thalassiosira oceanica]
FSDSQACRHAKNGAPITICHDAGTARTPAGNSVQQHNNFRSKLSSSPRIRGWHGGDVRAVSSRKVVVVFRRRLAVWQGSGDVSSWPGESPGLDGAIARRHRVNTKMEGGRQSYRLTMRDDLVSNLYKVTSPSTPGGRKTAIGGGGTSPSDLTASTANTSPSETTACGDSQSASLTPTTDPSLSCGSQAVATPLGHSLSDLCPTAHSLSDLCPTTPVSGQSECSPASAMSRSSSASGAHIDHTAFMLGLQDEFRRDEDSGSDDEREWNACFSPSASADALEGDGQRRGAPEEDSSVREGEHTKVESVTMTASLQLDIDGASPETGLGGDFEKGGRENSRVGSSVSAARGHDKAAAFAEASCLREELRPSNSKLRQPGDGTVRYWKSVWTRAFQSHKSSGPRALRGRESAGARTLRGWESAGSRRVQPAARTSKLTQARPEKERHSTYHRARQPAARTSQLTQARPEKERDSTYHLLAAGAAGGAGERAAETATAKVSLRLQPPEASPPQDAPVSRRAQSLGVQRGQVPNARPEGEGEPQVFFAA